MRINFLTLYLLFLRNVATGMFMLSNLIMTVNSGFAIESFQQTSKVLITKGKTSFEFSNSELLKKAIVKKFNNVPYGARTQEFKVVPLSNLLQNFAINKNKPSVTTSDGLITFACLDGFSANIELTNFADQASQHIQQHIQQHQKLKEAPTPYLAVEDPLHPWPKLSSGQSPGPFALVWDDPGNRMGAEQWPYQLVKLEFKPTLKQSYPGIFPAAKYLSDSVIMQGVQVFAKNCMPCHQINGSGDGTIGPDLNKPHNPLEYFKEEYFKMLVRNPASVRSWPESKMPSFDQKSLSDADFESLVKYLKSFKNL